MLESMKKTLLLVEDDAIIAMTSKRQLEQYEYSVIHVNTGEKAIMAIKTIPEIDLILMDINLGSGIDGTQAAEIILEDNDIPIVFVSSHTEPEIVEKTEKITSYGYVVKATGITVLDSSIKMAFKLFDANKVIRSSESKQKALISNISDVIGIIGADGILKYKSTNIEKWFGWKPEDLVGTDGWLTVHPDDRERIKKEFYEILKSDNLSSNVEYRYKCKDGSYKPIELTATNLVNDPAVNGVLLNYHDITERIKVQEALHESEKKYRLQFLNVNSYNSMYEVVMDEKGQPKDFRFVMVNQAYEKYVGKKASDLIGKTLLEVYPKTEQYWLDKMKEAVLTGTQLQMEAFSKEMNLYTEVSLYTPQKGFLAMTTANITERKKAEELLRESEEKYRLLYESAGIGIGYYSLEGIVLSYNNLAAKRMGGVPDDFLGKSIFDLFPKPNAEFYLKRIKAASICEKPTVYEDKVLLPTGDLYFLSTFTKITDKKNGILGIQIISQDITQMKKAELAVIESNEMFGTLANLAPVGIYLTNPNGDCTYANPAWCKMAGLSLEEAKGQGWINGLHPDDATMVFSKWIEMVSSKGGWGLEYRFKNRNGVVTDVYGLATAQFDRQGNIIHYIGINIDITERKLVEKKLQNAKSESEKNENDLRYSEEKYRAIVENSKDYIMRYDRDCRHIFGNTTAIKASGLTYENYVGKNHRELGFPEHLCELWEKNIKKVFDTGLTYTIEFDVELSGDPKYFELILSPEHDLDDTSVKSVIGISRDITERKKSDLALRESELRFKILADSGMALIWTADKDKLCNYFNQIWLDFTGRPLELELGNGWAEGVHPDDFQECLNNFTEAFDKREVFSMQYRLRRFDGEYRWILDEGCPRYDNNHDFLGYIGHCLDITEYKLADEKVKTLLSENELILKEVHHRIKNNMFTISSLLSLQAQTLKEPSVKKALNDANARVQSMGLLYDTLYRSADFSKVAVKNYIPSLVNQIIANFPNSNIVKIETAIDDFKLNTKHLQPISIIINELLTNIMKYAFNDRETGLILVLAKNSEGNVNITIQDNGNGIPETVSFENSTGFGLQLVQALTQQLDGTIRIERGNGTKVVLEFEI